MLRISIIFSALLFIGSPIANSQNTHSDDHQHAEKYCGTNEALLELLEKHPEYAPFIQETNADLERFTQNFSEPAGSRGSNYIIPVVFHIIHANGNENISDEQIFDAIDILTEDFTLDNTDVNDVIPEFAGIVANVGIEFRLAKLDPDGNCTNGIVRVVSNTTFNGGENLKNISPGWPRDQYINIWVASSLSGGAAGYTYNPSSVSGPWGADGDGIVIQNGYVGSIGTGSYGRSRALTHEVGHWINLSHPWGGTNDPGLSSNCNTDDSVSDTPNTVGWTSCNLNGSSCGSLDNVQNFMEYSYCSRMFTQGQRIRMLASLNSSIAERNSLHSASNLVATGVVGASDLCMVLVNSSVDRICTGESVTYTDQSYHGVTSRSWTFEGGTPATASGEEVEVFYDAPGIYNVQLEIENSSGESISQNFSNIVNVWPTQGTPLEYSEGFDDGNFDLETQWAVIETGATNSWSISENVSGASGNRALMLPNRNLPAGSESEIWSEPIDLSNTNTDVTLSFKYAYARRNPGNNERLMLWSSNNCGASWSLRGIWNNDFATVPYTGGFWYPSSSSDWETVEITNITESQLVSNFLFKFTFESDGGNNFFVDDINIDGPSVTGIDDHNISANVSVFPNPATNHLTVLVNGDKPYKFDLRLTNTLGQAVVAQKQLTFGGGQAQFKVETSDLAAGVYLLNIQTEAGEHAVKRVMIVR